jgi:hypothetical protein
VMPSMRRWARVEAVLHAASADEDACAEQWRSWERHDARRPELAAALSQTMAAEHIERVNARWAHAADAQRDPGGAHLATVVTTLLSHADTDRWGARLALPPAVAAVYLGHPGVWYAGQCVACRLPLPWRQRQAGDRRQAEPSGPLYFPACPDCGGAVAEWRSLPLADGGHGRVNG